MSSPVAARSSIAASASAPHGLLITRELPRPNGIGSGGWLPIARTSPLASISSPPSTATVQPPPFGRASIASRSTSRTLPLSTASVKLALEIEPELLALDEILACPAFRLGDADEMLEIVSPGAHHLGTYVEDVGWLTGRVSDAVPRASRLLNQDRVDPFAGKLRRDHRPGKAATDNRDRQAGQIS